MNKHSNWFQEVFFKSLVERFEQNGAFKLSSKQADICLRYMNDTDRKNFCREFNNYGIFQVSYSLKNPLKWRNGFWFEKIN